MDKQLEELSKSPAMTGVPRREALRMFGAGLTGVLLAYSGLGSTRAAAQSARRDGKDYLVVGSFNTNSVLSYDSETGVLVDQFDPDNLANLKTPSAGMFGPDGNLYVSSGIFAKHHQYLRQKANLVAVRRRQNLSLEVRA